MCRVIVGTLFAFATTAHTKDFVDKLTNKLIDDFFHRAFEASPFHSTGQILDDTTLDKHGQHAIAPPNSLRSVLPLRVHPTAPKLQRMSRPGAATTFKGKGDGEEDVEVVRFGLGRGSTVMYPKSHDTSPMKFGSPVAQYKDGLLDKVAIASFSWKMKQAVERKVLPADWEKSLPKEDFARLVALADLVCKSRTIPQQRQDITNMILSIMPPFSRQIARIVLPPGNFSDSVCAAITVAVFEFFVGPCEIVAREDDGFMGAVKVRKCRYLESCGCTASCVNVCKIPTQNYFRECLGLDATLAPNHTDGSCLFTFGRAPPSPDPAFIMPCAAGCSVAAPCSDSATGDLPPCHRIGEPP